MTWLKCSLCHEHQFLKETKTNYQTKDGPYCQAYISRSNDDLFPQINFLKICHNAASAMFHYEYNQKYGSPYYFQATYCPKLHNFV